MRLLLLALCLAAPVFPSDWHGYEKVEFRVDDVPAYIVRPRIPAPGNPWLWRARFPEFHPEAAEALLSKGFHLAYYDLPNIFGSPKAMEHFDHFYDHVTRQFSLSPRVALEGVSRGGLFVYNWAVRHPDRVTCIYCESPVCDMKSWPGGKGAGLGSPSDWRQALAAYGFTEDQMRDFQGNPIDTLEPLARRRIPVLHVVSENDRVVPPSENTAIFAARYRALGGPITVHTNTSGPETLNGHHFPLDNPALEVDFVLRHTPGLAHLAGTGLTPHGAAFYKLRDGLRNSLARFSQGGDARVVFLGGSITEGRGWRDQVCDWLRKRFPKTNFDFVNAGISSTGSTPGAFRLRRDVFGRGPVDLLFQEAAVNDATNGIPPRDQVRGVEGIVRQARTINPNIDVVLLHFADPDKLADYRAGRTPEVIRSHESVATRYALPSLDLAREVTTRIDAGEFTWDKDFVNLHPSPFGHGVYTRSITTLLDAAWREPAAGIRPHPQPPAIDEASYSRATLLEPAAARPDANWRLHPSWRPSDKAATRPRFVDVPVLESTTPGAELTFPFTGTAVGLFVTAGPDAGVIEYSIDGAPAHRLDLTTRWSRNLHLHWTHVLDAGLPRAPHRLRVRLLSGALRIHHFLVNE